MGGGVVRPGAPRGSDRTDFSHFRNEMPQEIFNAVLQCRRRTGAARAGALHVEKDDAIMIALESDVAAILGDRRAYAGFEEFLDRADDLTIRLGEIFLAGLIGLGGLGDDRRTGEIMLHDEAENRRLQML